MQRIKIFIREVIKMHTGLKFLLRKLIKFGWDVNVPSLLNINISIILRSVKNCVFSVIYDNCGVISEIRYINIFHEDKNDLKLSLYHNNLKYGVNMIFNVI